MLADENFLHSYLNKDKAEYKKTLEELTAFISYKSLEEEKRKEYAKYIDELGPALFHISPFELSRIELNLPAYSEIETEVYKKIGISDDEIKKLKKYRERTRRWVFRTPGLNLLALYSLKILSLFDKELKEEMNVEKYINERLITKEYKEILEERSKEVLKSLRLTTIPIYISSGILHYLRSSDITVEIAYLSSIMVSNILIYLPYTSKKFKSEKLRKTIPLIQILTLSSLGSYIYYKSFDPTLIGIYLLTVMLPYWILGIFEMGSGQAISNFIERNWPYLPKKIRRFIDKFRRFITNIKVKPFDEREIYEELYNASLRLEKISSLPSYVFEEFRDKLNKKIIKVENPEEKLAIPYCLGYYRKEIVLIEDKKNRKIVNRSALSELAQIYGMSVENFEKEVLRYPWKYLEADIVNDKLVYGRSVIGIYNFKNEAIRRGVSAKEVEACLLSLYAKDLILATYLK